MENQNFYEGRILVNMAASVMRQDDLKPLHGNLDWERLFRVADYNKISNLIYLAILGNNEKMPERWKTRFYERYSDILKFNESCTEGEREILVLLELKKIPVLVLSSSSRRQLYPREEMAGESSLKLFFLDPEDYLFAKGYLVNIGYETDTLYPEWVKRCVYQAVFLWRSIIPFLLKPRYTRGGWKSCSNVFS